MATKRILLKLSHAPGAPPGTSALAMGPTGLALTPLFDVPAPARSGLAMADDAARQHRWYRAEPQGPADDRFAGDSPWDLAHRALTEQIGLAADARLLAAEPDLEQEWPLDPPADLRGPALAAVAPCTPAAQKDDARPPGPGFAWHLGTGFTGLTDARNAVMAAGSDVTIVHLDTGFDPRHKTVPQGIDTARQRNFVETDRPNDATDLTPSQGILINRGHGTGTLGILAGNKLVGMLPPEANTGDYLGGAPLATVVPVRIANSVVHFWTSTVAQGINYAREIKADVVSMSMGGLPSQAWADAVNAAYEAGIVIVCAAGNNFGGAPYSWTVWPADFDRVIAACGVMANRRPYFNLPPWIMQGNHGPPSKMATAMAAFTPNIPWPKIGCENVVDLDGAGTSAATPQVAAAAALWLRKFKAQADATYREPWMRVEAVRKALFGTAGVHAAKPDELIGEGVLQANTALAGPLPSPNELTKTPVDQVAFPFLGHSLTGFAIDSDPRRGDLFRLELTHLALASKAARDAVPDPSVVDPTRIADWQRRRFIEGILDEGKCSRALRRFIEGELGRAPTVAAGRGAPEAATPGAPPTSSTLRRRMRRRPPALRRLQIFAVDPSLGSKLDTAFINKTVVEVAWETAPGNDNLLRPGPVGEYIEVVDVDPASGVAYDPVDLNEPFLLSQGGLAPSEGNPQFHQQMVYAVAMQTIDAFESALGRTALWAAKTIKTKDPATGKDVVSYDNYVPRLRIYPHALRQANAYYSPDKIALLLGYFPELRLGGDSDELGGIVFTCLSHDIVAHETTHALLDGLHHRYQESTNLDVLAFHEAFADIVAIFQHFTFPELLRFELARTRGDLRSGHFMADLAQQFGEALGRSKALRSAIGVDPTKTNYAMTTEPHERGSILVAAVFAAFLNIYQRRVDDLLRIATEGTGVLRPGALHPDLVQRLADEAIKSARHVLQICIRALDYCPPVDITFADYLRALITADADLVDDDKHGYRVAFLEAFRARQIYPSDVRTLSVESLQWGSPSIQPVGLGAIIRQLDLSWTRSLDRHQAFVTSKHNAAILHGLLAEHATADLAQHFGLNFSSTLPADPATDEFHRDAKHRPLFEVHSVRPAHRVSPDGDIKTDVIIVITQRRFPLVDPTDPTRGRFVFRGGCTLVVDPANDDAPIRYSIIKSIWSDPRIQAQRAFQQAARGMSLHSLYFGDDSDQETREPFALLHIGQ